MAAAAPAGASSAEPGAEGSAVALQKFACPACGAQAVWNASRQALACEFCGTVSPFEPAADEVVEHSLREAIAAGKLAREDRNAAAVSVKCRSCHAVSVLDRARVAQNCEFCGSAQLVPYEETRTAFRPESVLPFRVDEGRARDIVRRWYGRVWFAPNALKRLAATDTVRGVYLPYWTFDARVEADWTAEAGYYYYVTQTYRQGGQTRTRQERRVRWEPAAGHLSHFFDDDLVCGSVGVHPQLIRGIEPFPTSQLVPYDPAFVAGWVVERYQVDLADAAQASRASMEARTRELCAAKIPGDTWRNLDVRSIFSGETFKHALMPAWLLTYRYGNRNWQVAINGVTGAVDGEYPKSWVKIALALVAAVVFVLLVLSLGQPR